MAITHQRSQGNTRKRSGHENGCGTQKHADPAKYGQQVRNQEITNSKVYISVESSKLFSRYGKISSKLVVYQLEHARPLGFGLHQEILH